MHPRGVTKEKEYRCRKITDRGIDGVLVDAARRWRAETVEHSQFAMIQIRQSQTSATVIRLNSLFAHGGDGLPCRRIELRQIDWAAQAWH
jgi:hypothetical protein